MSESQLIEFKQSWQVDYLKWICAFPNAIREVQVAIFKVLQSGQAGGAIGGAMADLTYTQKEILEQIMENNKITYRANAAQMKINESAVLKHIDQLKEKGYLKRVGKTRGYWEVIIR